MASLAATLLCYFDEDMTFVMLVRLWQLRGLERLYQSGFQGLMDALGEFEREWLADGEVGRKLVSLLMTFLYYLRVFQNSNMGKAMLSVILDVPRHRPHRLRHPLVPDPLQLLHPLPGPTPSLGCIHAPRGLPPLPIPNLQLPKTLSHTPLCPPIPHPSRQASPPTTFHLPLRPRDPHKQIFVPDRDPGSEDFHRIFKVRIQQDIPRAVD